MGINGEQSSQLGQRVENKLSGESRKAYNNEVINKSKTVALNADGSIPKYLYKTMNKDIVHPTDYVIKEDDISKRTHLIRVGDNICKINLEVVE